MWFSRNNEYLDAYYLHKRTHRFVDKDFQFKYALTYFLASLVGLALIALPIYYFIQQNYQIFINLSHNQAPDLVDHLYREKHGLTIFVSLVCVGMASFFFILGIKMTQRIAAPLKILRNHLKKMSRGQWNIPTIRVREDDEFQDLIESYNYFFSSFQENIRRDLELLKKIQIPKDDKNSYAFWIKMIEEKSAQINQYDETVFQKPTFLSASKSSGDLDSQHAS